MQTLKPTCAGARPLSRRPHYAVPVGAWDCHCHVFGPIARFPYAEHRTYTPPEAPAEALLELHAALGFDHAVLVQTGAHGTDHRALLDSLVKATGRYRGVMLVEEGAVEVDFATLNAAGIRGVRFNLVPHLGVPPSRAWVNEVAANIAPLGWHILVHMGPSELECVSDFLKLGLPIVIDHMARLDAVNPDQGTLLDLLSHPLCWIKLSGIDRISSSAAHFTDIIPIARRLAEAAPDRCLWGSDFPHPNHTRVPDDASLVDAIPLIVPDAERQRRLLIDNPLRLYS